MRFFIIFVFVFVCQIGVFGQNYQPMLTVGSCWELSVVNPIMLDTSSYSFIKVIQDTIYNGQRYYIFNNFEDPWLREDTLTQKVYLRNPPANTFYHCLEGTEEMLLYDFSAEVGDTIINCLAEDNSGEFNYYYVVQNITEVESYSNYFSVPEGIGGRVFEIENYSGSNGSFSNFIFEGVGTSIGGAFMLPIFFSGELPFLNEFKRDCSFPSHNQNITPQNNLNLKISPNPTNNNTEISFNTIENENCNEIWISDILGNKLKIFKLGVGENSVLFNASKYPSGIFLCHFVCEGQILNSRQFISL